MYVLTKALFGNLQKVDLFSINIEANVFMKQKLLWSRAIDFWELLIDNL